MNEAINSTDAQCHPFVFRGDGGKYFLICLVNVLLCIITLGIYTPWALMKCRRYIYSNMEVNGQGFSFGVTGGNIFVSFLFVMVIYVAILMSIVTLPALGIVLTIALFVLLPFMVMKGLRYQAVMTSLNGVRFGFTCSMKRFWWIIVGLPIVLAIGLGLCVLLIAKMCPADSASEMIISGIVLALVCIVAIGIFNGTLFSKIMPFLWNNISFGIHRFEVKLDTGYCIKFAILAFVTLLPFIGVAGYIMFDQVMDEMRGGSLYGASDIMDISGFMEGLRKRIIAQVVYYFGIAVSTSYLTVSLRNHFMSRLSLDGGRIRFRSTMNYSGMLYRMCALVVVSGITGGLAYPLLKIWMISWQAQNTQVIGDLDALALENNDQQADAGVLAKVSRGIMPTLPFL
ncbi:YjgN family protein [Superficieibacter sp. BNK-5]|uniref:YjgN family protein n=1 Tax=Superficieibacter sp. BNK-5 TaxID=3376142 RepID=UPI0039BFC1BC